MSKDAHHDAEFRQDWDLPPTPPPPGPPRKKANPPKKVDPPPAPLPDVTEIETTITKPRGPIGNVEVRTLSAPQDVSVLLADPTTVVADRVLGPLRRQVQYRATAFAVSGMAVPNRIIAVVPGGLTEFTRALIFFHPLPTTRAGYDDAQYAAQNGDWRVLYRYCDLVGAQLAASGRKMVLIFPIFNLASTNTCGGFPTHWKRLIEDILFELHKKHRPQENRTLSPISDVITASFSAGVKYMHTFLKNAVGLSGALREVYDFDGRFSTEGRLSEQLASPGRKVVTYDQRSVATDQVVREEASGRGIHVPEERWRDLPDGRTSFDLPMEVRFDQPAIGSNTVHGAIVRYLLFHALSRSAVGK